MKLPLLVFTLVILALYVAALIIIAVLDVSIFPVASLVVGIVLGVCYLATLASIRIRRAS